MSYNGSGTFAINTSGQPVVAGTVISSTAFNALTADLATGLSTAITKDGQTTTTARIPFAAGINSSSATDSTSTSTGSIITSGGVGVAKALYVGTTANVAGAATLSSTLTYGGVTLTNAVTGTGKMVLDTSPTISGLTASGANLSLPVIDNIKMGYTTTATAGGTTTLTAASNHQQFFTGTLAQTIVLPVTSTLALGMSYSIENNSTGTLTVQSSGANTITTIPAGVTVLFTCILITGTTAASWDYDHIGFAAITGTGSAVLGTAPTIGTPTLGSSSTDTVLITGAPSIGGAGLGMGMGFRNRIINGQMQIAQRATSATITAGSTIAAGYSTVDRFYVYCTGANVTAAQVSGSGATRNRLQITGAASVTAVGIGQRIEALNSYDMAGSTAKLSLDISNSLLTTVTWTAYYANTTDTFGTLASPTRTQIATGTFTVTSTLTNYSTQISIPSAATTGIEIVLTVGAQTSGTWVVGNIQLEKGSTATSFDVRPYGTELALCQRYFFQYQGNATATPIGSAYLASTVSAQGYLQFPVPMRAAPTQTGSATTDIQVTWSAGTSTTSALTLDLVNTLTASLRITTTGLTTGQGGYFLIAAGTSKYLAFSAEL